MGVFILLSAASVVSCGPDHEGSFETLEHDPLIELRLAHAGAASGRQSVLFAGDTLYLAPRPVVSDSDFERVAVRIQPDGVYLELQLTPEATERLISVTSEELGNRLAMIVGSQVRSAPVIQDVVGGPRSIMVIPASEEEARRLAALIVDRWPEDP